MSGFYIVSRILMTTVVILITSISGLRAGQSLRIVNLSPDAPPVDLYVNDTITPARTNIAFRGASQSVSTTTGLQIVKVAFSGNDPSLAFVDNFIDVPANVNMSLLVLDSVTNIHARTLNFYTQSVPSPDSVYLRIAHAAPGSGTFDVKITDYKGNPTMLTNIPFEAVSGFLSYPKGTISVEVFRTGTKQGLLNVSTDLSAGGYRTLIISGGTTDLRILAYNESDTTAQSPIPTMKPVGVTGVDPRIRFVNGISGAPSADVFIDSVEPAAAMNIAYRDASQMLSVMPGTHNIKVGITGFPVGSALLSQDFGGNVDTVYTGVGVGALTSSINLAVLTRYAGVNIPSDSVLVRVLNGGAALIGLDVAVDVAGNDDFTIADLAWAQASEYRMVGAGPVTVGLTPVGQSPVYLGGGIINGGTAVTFVISGTISPDELVVSVLHDTDTSRQSPMEALTRLLIPTNGAIRVVNVALDPLAVQAFLNNNAAEMMVMNDGDASPTTDDYSGILNVKFTLPGDGLDKPVVNADVELEPDALSTLFLVGRQSGIGLDTVVLRMNVDNFDFNPQEFDTTKSIIRVLHAMPDTNSIDVQFYLNDGNAKSFKGMKYRQSTKYFIAASGFADVIINGQLYEFTVIRNNAYTLIIDGATSLGRRDPWLLRDGLDEAQVPMLRLQRIVSSVPVTQSTRRDLSISPNPTSGEATVAYHLDQPGSARVVISDLTGRTVFTQNIGHREMGDASTVISTQNLSAGMYSVVLVTDDGNTVGRGRVVVVK